MKKTIIVVIHKEPIVERVPNLKAMIEYLAQSNFGVNLITTRSKKFPTPVFQCDTIKMTYVDEKASKYGVPTTIKFIFKTVIVYMTNILTKQNCKYIYAGRVALIISALMRFLGMKRYAGFVVEYPSLVDVDNDKPNLFDKLEISGLNKSIFYITHDTLHGELINTKTTNRNHKYFTLPNSTLGEVFCGPSKFLHLRMGVDCDTKILLHSGGFGAFFQSKELSTQSMNLPFDMRLVFHVSHDIRQDPYYKDYLKDRPDGDSSLFSMLPVASHELNNLIVSAYIGIAWYDKKVLGFRAEMLGLSAGKIGAYLKCGIPVIAPSFGSLSYLVEYECGILVESLVELRQAVDAISKNYNKYSANAYKCYHELWKPDVYLEHIKVELSSM